MNLQNIMLGKKKKHLIMIPLLSKNRLNKKYVYCLRIQSIWYTDKVMITQNSKFTCGRGEKRGYEEKGPKESF